MAHFAVIFDMDGVLVDSYQAHLASWQATGRRHGLQMTHDDFAKTFGRRSHDIIKFLWAGQMPESAMDGFDAEKEAAYRDELRKNFPAMAGAPQLIAALHTAGFALAIGSSGPAENVALVRELLPNGSMIQQAVSAREVTVGKPDPQVFLKAAAKLGVEPRECAVIEDAPAGIEAARRAGMVAIALTGTATREVLGQQAHRVVDRLSELTPEAIASLIRSNQNSAPPAALIG